MDFEIISLQKMFERIYAYIFMHRTLNIKSFYYSFKSNDKAVQSQISKEVFENSFRFSIDKICIKNSKFSLRSSFAEKVLKHIKSVIINC